MSSFSYKHQETLIEYKRGGKLFVNGELIISKPSLGAFSSNFTIEEAEEVANYRVYTRIDGTLGTTINISRNGEPLVSAKPMLLVGDFSTPDMQKLLKNSRLRILKNDGVKKLKEFDVKEALIDLKGALAIEATDADIHFALAKVYSILEQKALGFKHLRLAVKYDEKKLEESQSHEQLAYLRLQPTFAEYLQNPTIFPSGEFKLEHTGIAVKNLETSNQLFKTLFDQPHYKIEEVASEFVKTSFFKTGSSKIELLEASDPNSAIAKFIEKKGEGIHHIAFEVKDIRVEMKRLEAEGFKILNKEPKRGADNKLVCFIHPKTANGVLVELCQTIK